MTGRGAVGKAAVAGVEDREADTIDMMAHMTQGIVGKRPMYKDLIA